MRPPDRDWLAVSDPTTHPQLLAEIAGRRWDLHPLIANHPHVFPQLRSWIATVNPNSVNPGRFPAPAPHLQNRGPQVHNLAPQGQNRPQYGPAPTQFAQASGPYARLQNPSASPQRRGVWGWFVGLGCLGAVIALVLVVAATGTSVVPADPDLPLGQPERSTGYLPLPSRQGPAPGTPAPTPSRTSPLPTRAAPSTDPAATYTAAFHEERTKYNKLAAQLNGNPVAPLVTHEKRFRYLEEYMSQPGVSERNAKKVAEEARGHRQDLEKSIKAAEKRRGNASGTAAEKFIHASGDGFIDLAWDAKSACKGLVKPGMTVGGCVKGNVPKIHLRADDGIFGAWAKRMILVHEVAHVYQNVDTAIHHPAQSKMDKLLAKGLFKGSRESMADCYALTYLKENSLRNGNAWVGYGYECSSSERRAIRQWAKDINVPMTK